MCHERQMMHQAALTRTKFHFLESFSSPCSLLLTSDDGEFVAAGCSGCLPNKKAASNRLWKCLKVVFYQVCMSADKRSCRNVSFFNGAWRDILSTEGKMARITSNVICVTLLCLSPCLCMWAKSQLLLPAPASRGELYDSDLMTAAVPDCIGFYCPI